MICTLFLNKYAHISMRSQKPEKKRRCANGSIEPTALALSISRDLLKNKRVINILPNLQAYFNKRRFFTLLRPYFAAYLVILFSVIYVFRGILITNQAG